MNVATPRMKGYLILLLSLFIFTMWGVNLLSLSQIEIDKPEPSGAPKQSGGGGGGNRVIEVKPCPFLYFYFYELGYTLYLTSAPPREPNGTMLMVEPPERLPSALLRQLAEWLGKGGNLVILTSRSHPILSQAGIDVATSKESKESSQVSRLFMPYLWLNDAREFDAGYAGWKAQAGRSFLKPFLPPSPGVDPVLVTGWGSGRLCIAASAELTGPAGLRKRDNLVLLTRLAERLTPSKQLFFFDPEPGRRLRAVVSSGGGGGGGATPVVKTKIPYLSLWSLMKANAVSWALLQLVLALAIFAISIGRRFGPVRPIPPEDPPQQSFVACLGQLLRRQQINSFAASHAIAHFLPAAFKRFGLPPDAPASALVEAMKSVRPDLAEKLGAALTGLKRITESEGSDESDARLLHHMQTLAQIRKELRING
ncbi:MAG TPA: DUF4350 domain-containing protein [Candidatus Ozemobacteraceae bacterium]|nr:DUF4350 domain-containing protein [Candidatus Ozemobacteraceae bacterium]